MRSRNDPWIHRWPVAARTQQGTAQGKNEDRSMAMPRRYVGLAVRRELVRLLTSGKRNRPYGAELAFRRLPATPIAAGPKWANILTGVVVRAHRASVPRVPAS
jgi:hypothetical protein